MKVYVAGPMTGIKNWNRPSFEAAALRLRERGFEAVIPHTVVDSSTSWHDAMRADIKVMLGCEMVYLLEGWRNSRGARLEAHIALQLEMRIETEIPEGALVCPCCVT